MAFHKKPIPGAAYRNIKTNNNLQITGVSYLLTIHKVSPPLAKSIYVNVEAMS